MARPVKKQQPARMQKKQPARIKPREGLNRMQERALRQQERQDVNLGGTAGGLLPEIGASYEQPFDFSALPSAPVSGDFSDWRNQQIQQSYNLFSKRQEPQFQQQQQDLEQQLYNRGIPVGSELYNNQMQQLQRQQEDARQSAMVNAQGIAGQNAGQFFDIGTQARGNALSEGLLQRNMPLNEYAALMGARSGLAGQNLAYSQERGLTGLQADLQLRNARQMPRGGGGGGEVWQQYGFSSPLEYDAYQTQKKRDEYLWALENTPGQDTPNPYGSLLGNIAGSALAGWGASGFKKFW